MYLFNDLNLWVFSVKLSRQHSSKIKHVAHPYPFGCFTYVVYSDTDVDTKIFTYPILTTFMQTGQHEEKITEALSFPITVPLLL